MKYTIVTVALATLVSTQSLSDIPQCALPCIDSARTSSTSCSASDYACICKNKDAITAAATSCVLQACGADVATSQVLPAVNSFCSAVESGSGGSSSASVPVSSSSATASSSSMDVTSTSDSATETATESATSSGETSTSAEACSATSATSMASMTSMTSMASTTVSGSNSTASYTSSQPTTVPTGGASSAAGSLAMLVLGFVAAI
ncbi:hypothetical protein F4805DRAFT_331803 [Annulohypoxylon moriforme]|nr:hypothetical protein F4805DRAFT_331803 [Annulohypoxylon moriforme]